MTLRQDDLTRPLGLETATGHRRGIGLAGSQLFVVAVAGLFLALALWLALARDPLGGEPYAIVPIERRAAPAPEAAPSPPRAEAAPERATAAELEKSAGVTVVRNGGDAPVGVVIRAPETGERLAAAPDPRLVERVRHHVLPRIGEDGARPSEVYARPAPPPSPKAQGRVAVMVGGLGISAALTADAVARLPAEVTLAFSPYGAEVDRQVARAREGGHEVILQAPMEPFDYSDSDPGPHTLTVNAAPADVMDRLYWVMSRFPGYVGVANAMGGKFTANEAALAPVLREIGARGLLFVDDGSSQRSLVTRVAPGAGVQAARVDARLDAVANAAAIDAELARLEATAREKGVAIGAASPTPVSMERIVRWARTLDDKGLQLVPVSAAVRKPGRN